MSLLSIVALGPNPLPESLQWVSPLPHNYTLPSLPLLPPGCHSNQPARSRPASRRSDHPVSFPCSPEPAPSSGLVLFKTLRGTLLWWRSQTQTGSGFATALWVRSAAHHSSQRRRSDPGTLTSLCQRLPLCAPSLAAQRAPQAASGPR